jgi:hypothetical protein
MVRPFHYPVNASDLPDWHSTAKKPLTVKAKARQPKTAICLLMEVKARRLPLDRINHQNAEGTIDGTRLEYFKARLDATMTPVDLLRRIKGVLSSICVVDVRNGPPQILIDRRRNSAGLSSFLISSTAFAASSMRAGALASAAALSRQGRCGQNFARGRSHRRLRPTTPSRPSLTAICHGNACSGAG